MTEEEKAAFARIKQRLAAAEAQAWACRKVLSLLMLVLEKRGILDRRAFFELLDTEHLEMLETSPLPASGAETERLIVETLRYICGPPRAD